MSHDAVAVASTSQGMMRPSSSSSAGPSTMNHQHPQSRRRFFIGSMPNSTPDTEHDEQEAADFVREHGLRIFLRQGGRLDEWSEAKAKEYKERLKRRILENTEWYKERKRKKKRVMAVVEWSGETFEIGKVAGVSVNMLSTPLMEELEGQDGYMGSGGSSQRETRPSASMVHWDSTPRMSFVTARSTLSYTTSHVPSTDDHNRPKTVLSAPTTQGLRVSSDGGTSPDESTSSRTPLFVDTMSSPASIRYGESRSEGQGPSIERARTGLKSILNRSGRDKSKKMAVRYAASPDRIGTSPGGSDTPAPPQDVLERTLSEVGGSSAAAAAEATQSSSELGTDDVILRDRMLVRVFRCEHENIKYPFGEKECRVMRGLDNKEWDEFLVIWKNQRLELYESYWTPCKERLLGHKHLAFVIPLLAPTKISVFSPVDLSFSLICRPTPTTSKTSRSHRSIFHRSSRGLNVFILRPKSRSRAVDWIWRIWEKLGGVIPTSIEVFCPLVHARVSIPIPETGEDWKGVTRDYIIDQCTEALEDSFAWKTVIELPITKGRRLELCWKTDTRLDWVWLKDDVDGYKRDWEVLFGLAIEKLGCPGQLQLHLATHYPAEVTSKDHKHFEEPPSIEGYAYLYKRKTQGRKQYYLSTHDHYLCAIAINKVVHPPTPTDLRSFARSEEEFLAEEKDRLRNQLIDGQRIWDLRQVLVVRRAKHVIAQFSDHSVLQQHLEAGSLDGPNLIPDTQDMELELDESEMQRSNSDVEDEGGDLGMSKAKNKGKLKMYRSFELVMKNGRLLRFEVRRTKDVVEWVTHLRALVSYWKGRVYDDTRNEMKILKETGNQITVSKRYCKDGHEHWAPVVKTDPENSTMYLDEFWNWCVIDGCRQILRSGKLYMKKKLRGAYRHTYNILIRGHLLYYKVGKHGLGKGKGKGGDMHHQQIGHINLMDAYVCSGYYAALALADGEYDPNAPEVAKLFEDGLETKDAEEDTLFLVWYRPHGGIVKTKTGTGMDKVTPSVLPLNSKHQMKVFRARSKLERDAWCWALNCEIERLVRETKEREVKLRE